MDIEDKIGSEIGPYKLVKALGQGGMAMVFKAFNLETGDIVALKTLKPEAMQSQQIRQRFNREYSVLRKLEHKNIIKVFAYHQRPLPEADYYTMEFVSAPTLFAYLKDCYRFKISEVLDILLEMTQALAHAHAKNIVHRDIKPGNVFYQKGLVKIMDFGIASVMDDEQRITRLGFKLGTATHMSPEQVKGIPIDQRSDIYTLGILTFELLAGYPPFEAKDPFEIMRLQLEATHPNIWHIRPDISWDLAEILNKCLKKDPNERYQNIQALMYDLQHGFSKDTSKQTVIYDSDDQEEMPQVTLSTFDPQGAFIVILTGPQKGEVIPLTPDQPFEIGRHEGVSQLYLTHDKWTSRAHARLNYEAPYYFLTDLDSRNGTFVRKKQLQPFLPYPLQYKDIFRIGRTYLAFGYKKSKT